MKHQNTVSHGCHFFRDCFDISINGAESAPIDYLPFSTALKPYTQQGKRIETNMIDSDCPCSALYARNPVRFSIQDRLDAVHKAQHVG